MPNQLRFTRGAGQDKTFRTVTQDAQQIAYGVTITITPVEQVNLIQVAELTGGVSISSNNQNLFIGDIVKFLFLGNGDTNEVTFGGGFATNSTDFLVPNFGYIEFIFNGQYLQETGRALSAD